MGLWIQSHHPTKSLTDITEEIEKQVTEVVEKTDSASENT